MRDRRKETTWWKMAAGAVLVAMVAYATPAQAGEQVGVAPTPLATQMPTCACETAKVRAHCDNKLTFNVWENDVQVGESQVLESWPDAFTAEVDIGENTRLEFICKDKGSVGGFIATIDICGTLYTTTDETSTTPATYTLYINEDESDLAMSDDAPDLVYTAMADGPWNKHASDDNMPGGPVWVWDSSVNNKLVFEFDMSCVPSSTEIKIEISDGDNKRVLTVCEVVVFDKEGNQLTLFDAEQSSVSHGGNPDKAIDGSFTGPYYKSGVAQCMHTIAEVGPYWKARIPGNAEDIGRIELYSRSDCCTERLVGAKVYLDGEEVYTVENEDLQHTIDLLSPVVPVTPVVLGDCGTCETAKVRAHCDNKLTFNVWENDVQVGESQVLERWPDAFTADVNIGENTRLEFICEDKGSVGGFIATIDICGTLYTTTDETSTTPATYTLYISEAESDDLAMSDDAPDLVYTAMADGRWKAYANNDNMPGSPVWVWDSSVNNKLVFEFDMSCVPSSTEIKIEISDGDNKRVLTVCEVVVFDKEGNQLTLFDAEQSSVSHGGNPDKAIDGSFTGPYYKSGVAQCMHTIAEVGPYWKARIPGNAEDIGRIELYSRSDCCTERLVGAKVYLDGEEVYTVENEDLQHTIDLLSPVVPVTPVVLGDCGTCETAKVRAHCDNKLTFNVWENDVQVGESQVLERWPDAFTADVNIGENTRLEFICEDKGSVGGFIATIDICGTLYTTTDETSTTPATYTLYINEDESDLAMSDDAPDLVYTAMADGPWNKHASDDNMPGSPVWVWDSSVNNKLVFEFDMSCVPSSTEIKIEISDGDNKRVLTVCEVVVFDKEGNQLTLFDAEQSSVSHGGNPDKAIDGSFTGPYYKSGVAQCMHTIAEVGPYWKARIPGNAEDIGRIELYSRSDCCTERLVGAKVYLDGEEVYTVENEDLQHTIDLLSPVVPVTPVVLGDCGTCETAKVRAHCDNKLTFNVWENDVQVGESQVLESWPDAFTADVNIGENTRLEFICEDKGSVGGFIATIDICGTLYTTDDETSTTPATYTLYINEAESDLAMSDDAPDLVYTAMADGRWKAYANNENMPGSPVWVWDSSINNKLVFEFDMSCIPVENAIVHVFEDKNGNSKLDSSEKGQGIPGVAVSAVGENGHPFYASVPTDAQGMATIRVPPGPTPFHVLFDLAGLPGAGFAEPDAAGDEVDSDAAQSTGMTGQFVIAESGTPLDGIAAGVWLPGSTRVRAWADKNGNGKQDNDEADMNVAGVVVTALEENGSEFAQPDGIVAAPTDNEGIAHLTWLPADRPFTFQFDISGLQGYAFTGVDKVNDAVDSDADPEQGSASGKAMASVSYRAKRSAEELLGVGVGVWAPGSAEVRAWNDMNGNGKQDSGESGANIAGVVVTVVEEDGVTVITAPDSSDVTATSGSDGLAKLDWIPADRPFKLHFDISGLPGYAFAEPDKVNDAEDSDADPALVQGEDKQALTSATYRASKSDEVFTSVDAGLWAPGSAVVRAWNDMNGNGKQDSGESGANIAGVVVTVVEEDGVTVITAPDSSDVTATSGSDGLAKLDWIPADRPFKLHFDISGLPGYAFAVADKVNDMLDSDADPTLVQGEGKKALTSATYRASKGKEEFTSIDVGLWAPGSAVVRAWDDTNGNGKQDSGEADINVAGVVVTVVEADGSVLASPSADVSQASDETGLAVLPWVPADRQFKLKFDISNLWGYRFAPKDAVGNNDMLDSDADYDGSGAQTVVLSTTAYEAQTGSEVFENIDVGLWSPGSATVRAWFDENKNGKQDIGETAFNLAGISVALVDASTMVAASDADSQSITGTTGQDGLVQLGPVSAAGAFRICIQVPEDFVLTSVDASNDALDSDIDPETLCSTADIIASRGDEQYTGLAIGFSEISSDAMDALFPPPPEPSIITPGGENGVDSGESGSGESGSGESGSGESGSGESGSGESGSGESGSGESGSGESGSGESGSGESGSGESGSGESGSGESGSGESGSGESGSGESGSGEAGSGEAGSGEAGSGEEENNEDSKQPCKSPYDIMFIVQEVEGKDWRNTMKFLRRVLKGFNVGPEASRMGLVSYSSDVNSVLKFGSSSSVEKRKFKKFVGKQLKENVNVGTTVATGKALQKARALFASAAADSNARIPDRRVAVLVTSSPPDDASGCPNDTDPADCARTALQELAADTIEAGGRIEFVYACVGESCDDSLFEHAEDRLITATYEKLQKKVGELYDFACRE